METKNKPNKFINIFNDNQFSPDDAAKGLFLFIVFSTIISYTFEVVATLNVNVNFWSYFFTVIIDISFVLSVWIVAKSRNKNFIPNLKVENKINIIQVVLALVIAGVSIFAFSGITNLFMEFLGATGYRSNASSIVVSSFGRYILYTVLICVLPAICEEILFRGLIFTGLKKVNFTFGVIGSAFLFMLMHQNPDQTVHQFLLGILLALAFNYTNSIWMPMLIHFFNNFIAVTYSFIAYGDSDPNAVVTTVEISLFEYLLFAIITLAIGVALLYFIFKLLNNINIKKVNDNKLQIVDENQFAPVVLQTDSPDYITTNNNQAVQNIVDFENVETAEEVDNQIYRETISSKMRPENRLSKTGIIMLVFSIGYMGVMWFLSYLMGLLI